MGRRSPGAGAVALSLKIFLVAVVAVIVVLVAVVGSRLLTGGGDDRPAVDVVDRGRATFVAGQRERYARLGTLAALLGREPTLQQVLRGDPLSGDIGPGPDGGDGREALADLLYQRREDLGFDFALVLDADGRVLATNEEADLVDLAGRDVSRRPLVARGLEEGAARGVWQRGDGRLAHAAIEWVTPEFDLLGYVVVGFDLNEVLALEIQRTSGAGVAFLSDRRTGNGGGAPGLHSTASTFDATSAERLAQRLLAPSGDLATVFAGDDTHQGVEVDLGDAGGFGAGGGVFEALLAPLRDAGGSLVGAVLIAAPVAAGAGDPTVLWTAVGAVAALVLALLMAALVGRSTLAPVRRLTGLVQAAPREGFARRPEPRRAGPLAPLAAALGRLFRDLQEERALSAAASAAATQGAEDGDDSGSGEAARERVAVLAVDLKRYAGPAMADEEPRQVAARWEREVGRVRHLVRGLGGRLVSAAGHRVYATFGEGGSGDDGAHDTTWRAVVAGGAVLSALARGESAFDEGDPPAVAVVSGRLTHGTAAGGRPVLVGTALQLAESLLREAAAGDLVLPRGVYREVEARLASSGVEVGEQSGLLSPQPLFVVRPSAASRLAAAAPGGGGAVGGGAAVGDTMGEPGDVLEERFEVVERLGSSPAGDLLRVLDRELDQPVALKRLLPAALRSDDAVGLESPLGAVRRFSHPAVAELYEFGTLHGDGAYAGGVFLARAWVPGVPLGRVGEMAPAAGLAVGRRLAAILAEVHGVGLHHGRVTPGNLILVPGQGLWLTDLGVALLVGSASGWPAGERLRAPEQEDGAAGDARSDVFAAGALMARLVSRRWWTGPGAEPGGDLPPGLDAVLRRSLQPDPDARYPHAGALLEAMDGVSV